MQKSAWRLLIAAFVGALLVPAAWAKFKGLSLSTPYPEQSVQAGQPVVIPLTVRSFGLDPQQVKLKVLHVASGWKAEFEGDARDVGAVFVEPGDSQDISLHLTPPKGANGGSYSFLLEADGSGSSAQLPLTLHLAKSLPNWLSLSASLPTLKGSASTKFSYDVKLTNRSGRDVTVNFAADSPPGFEVDFTPQYGSQNVTAMRVKAGESKDMSVKVSPPGTTQAGHYPFTIHAAAGDTHASLPLAMDVTGKAELILTTPSGRLSGEATVGKPTTINLEVANSGSAAAHNVSFSADSPSNWKVSFDPKKIATIGPNQTAKVTADITPADKSLAGDYMVSLDAVSGPDSTESNYRVTVVTSTLWGIAGVAIVAAAVLVVGFAIARFGRR